MCLIYKPIIVICQKNVLLMISSCRDEINWDEIIGSKQIQPNRSDFFDGWNPLMQGQAKLWIILTTTPLRIAWNSPNLKSLANMRVLEGVAHVTDWQHVAKFSFAKRTVFTSQCFAFRTVPSSIQQPSSRDWYWIMVGWQSYQTELWLGTERNGSKNSVWYGCKPTLIQYQSLNNAYSMIWAQASPRF